MSGSAKNARFKELEVRCRLSEQELGRQKELSRMQARCMHALYACMWASRLQACAPHAHRMRTVEISAPHVHCMQTRATRLPPLASPRTHERSTHARTHTACACACTCTHVQAGEHEDTLKALEEAHRAEVAQKQLQLHALSAERAALKQQTTALDDELGRWPHQHTAPAPARAFLYAYVRPALWRVAGRERPMCVHTHTYTYTHMAGG